MARRAEGRFNVDGLGVNGSSGGGTLYVTDTANAAEVTIDVTGGLGEAEAGGPVINVVPKTGGNSFSGSGFAAGANGSMQGSNFDDALLAAGLREPGKLKKLWETNGAIGGPIKKDKLWFFLTGRYQGTERYVAGMYYNKNAGNPNAWTYDPDFSRQAISDGVWNGTTLRTTWQISSRQKLNLFWDEQDMCRNCWGGGSATTSPEAQDGSQNINWIHAYQASYTAPLTSQILVEAGFGAVNPSYGNPRDGFDRSIVRTVEQAGPIPNLAYRSMFWDQVRSFTPRYRAALSYVTGPQNLKVGFETYNNISTRNYQRGDRAAVPAQQRRAESADDAVERFHREGARAEHRASSRRIAGRFSRFTLEGGVRYENARSSSPEQVIGPSRFVPTAIVFPAQRDRERLQRHHAPRRRRDRPVRRRQDLAEDQRRPVRGSGAVGRHLHRAQPRAGRDSAAACRRRPPARGPTSIATMSRIAICSIPSPTVVSAVPRPTRTSDACPRQPPPTIRRCWKGGACGRPTGSSACRCSARSFPGCRLKPGITGGISIRS